jgi:DNA-binding response OmpR family regulator
VPHIILLVDDDDALRDALHRTLVGAGYEVADASGGTAALQAYQRQRYDLVITDIVMADGEGLDAIRALRKLDAQVKIIAISGGGTGKSADYLALAGWFGAMRVLAKPFSGEELLAAAAEVLAGGPAKGPTGS